MTKKIKIHDGIIGVLLSVSAVLVDPRFVWLTIATGAIMLQSAFSGFCPVHYLVEKAFPEDDKASA